MAYAKGKFAVGICARSGIKMRLLDMVEDGYKPGLMVHPAWRDEKHPQERPVKATDPQALKRPAPDVDDDSAGNNGQLLKDIIDGPYYFGGGT